MDHETSTHKNEINFNEEMDGFYKNLIGTRIYDIFGGFVMGYSLSSFLNFLSEGNNMTI